MDVMILGVCSTVKKIHTEKELEQSLYNAGVQPLSVKHANTFYCAMYV